MKYKVKVEVMQDGNSRYYPMVKKHWWSVWEYIDRFGCTHFDGYGMYYAKKGIAELCIKMHKGLIIDHTYEIPYKEEE